MKKPPQTHITRQWFSSYFGVNLPQYELPFVDFDLKSDVPLYIDPYAITKDPSDLAARCHNIIRSYFQALLDAIRGENRQEIRRLIRGHFSEPDEIHLGVSRVARKGRGIGQRQEDQIVEALAKSDAARKGVIQAIQELELHIDGIGPDKISDLVGNLLLSELAQYTGEICQEFAVATRPCAVNGFWDPKWKEWTGGYFNLPAKNTHDYILVPKRFIRRDRDLTNHREFYDKYVLEVIQREMLNASDSLVQTLKNGNRRVTKKSLKEDPRFKPNKAFISQFIIAHPNAIAQYRKELKERYAPADPAEFSGKATADDKEILRTLAYLPQIPTGKQAAKDFHSTVFELVRFIFDWCLENFGIEYKTFQGRGRIDIIADNSAPGGLFSELRQRFNANSIPIECKNYGADLGNNEFNQLLHRLGRKTSRLGIIFCRQIRDKAEMQNHQEDRYLHQEVMILLLDDADLTTLVQRRLERDFVGIELFLRRKLRDVEWGSPRR